MVDKNIISNALRLSRDTKFLEMGFNAILKVPELFKTNFPGRKAVVVADCNTWKAAGEKVFAEMNSAGIDTVKYIFPEKEFHPDDVFVHRMDKLVEDTGAVTVAVGSGVINDLCKIASFHHHQQYMCVATAASVDGYSSSGAVVNSPDGAKINVETQAPLVIVGDYEVLSSAPKEMTAAGYADLAAKVPAGAEWMIADAFGTEPIIPDAWHVLFDSLDNMLASPEKVAACDPESIGDLFVGLTLSGVAMQIAKSSRPASCSEHLFSHYLDMTHYRFNGKLQSHGFQVAVGTLTMCAFFDEFLKMDLSELDVDKCVSLWPSLEQEQQRALDIYGNFPVPKLGYTEITKKYNDAETVRRQLERVKSGWPVLKERLQRQVYSFERMRRLFSIVGAPVKPEDIGLTNKDIRDIVPFVQLMRWRINLLDLAKRGCFYDELVSKVFGKGGAWEI
ncbi:MAG: sn-glycerol-1-phosphate dehydrogenase [Bacteroidales bacterium]